MRKSVDPPNDVRCAEDGVPPGAFAKRKGLCEDDETPVFVDFESLKIRRLRTDSLRCCNLDSAVAALRRKAPMHQQVLDDSAVRLSDWWIDRYALQARPFSFCEPSIRRVPASA